MAYSDAEKAEALIKLALNFYNFEKTSEQLGVAESTLRVWDKQSADIAQKKDRFDTADLLERAVQRLLMNVPAPKTLNEWGIAVGILLDKVALFRGMPTERHENVFKKIGDMPDDEFDKLLDEAQRIIDEADGGGDDFGDGEGKG